MRAARSCRLRARPAGGESRSARRVRRQGAARSPRALRRARSLPLGWSPGPALNPLVGTVYSRCCRRLWRSSVAKFFDVAPEQLTKLAENRRFAAELARLAWPQLLDTGCVVTQTQRDPN